ncbi:hypothetical protein TNCT_271661 [Trichonephila clavata]|uniref:Uncharacterized protein n=1 Tax=Trichonephila clavata TaxID=2740835 RepID=A0A8X6HMD5_TRICU|nr:hypothetical protein TNCT_271661 [Trichonephila clavata]
MAVEYIYLFWAYGVPQLSTQIHKEGVFNEELPDFVNCVDEAKRLFFSVILVFGLFLRFAGYKCFGLGLYRLRRVEWDHLLGSFDAISI